MCRWYFLLEYQLSQLLDKPLKNKDKDIHLLLLLGLYQLQFTRVAPHAAVNETVNAVQRFRKPWAKQLVNGVLRQFLRDCQHQQAASDDDHLSAENLNDRIPSGHKIAHPQWLQQRIVGAWPAHSKQIFAANNHHPPFTLRVNVNHHSVDQYRDQLDDSESTFTSYSQCGLTLANAKPVQQLLRFCSGALQRAG